MKIKIIGKTTATVGNSVISVRGPSGRKFPFRKTPGEGYVYETKDNGEAEEIFRTQHMRMAYYFTPILGEDTEETAKKEKVDYEDKTLEELKEICQELEIKILPQDKERALKRMLEAYNLGLSSQILQPLEVSSSTVQPCCMAENLTSGIAPTLRNLKDQLATLYGADGSDDLSPIDQQRVGIYINQAYRECYAPAGGGRPDWAVANYGIELPGKLETTAQCQEGSDLVTLDDAIDPKFLGSYIEIDKEYYVISDIEGNDIKILTPWPEGDGPRNACVYFSAHQLDREVIDVCSSPEIVGWGRMSPMQSKEQEIEMRASYAADFMPYPSQHYGNVPTIASRGRDFHVDRPLWYYIDSSDLQVYSEQADTTDLSKKALRNRFCVYPLPPEKQTIRLRANILPLELTNDDDVARLPGNVVWDILFPMASATLALSDPRYSGDNKEAIFKMAEGARSRLRSLSSSQKKKPIRLKKRFGW